MDVAIPSLLDRSILLQPASKICGRLLHCERLQLLADPVLRLIERRDLRRPLRIEFGDHPRIADRNR